MAAESAKLLAMKVVLKNRQSPIQVTGQEQYSEHALGDYRYIGKPADWGQFVEAERRLGLLSSS